MTWYIYDILLMKDIIGNLYVYLSLFKAHINHYKQWLNDSLYDNICL